MLLTTARRPTVVGKPYGAASRSDVVRPDIGAGLLELPQFGSEGRDDATAVGAAPDTGRRLEDLQFATHPVDGLVQLLAKGFF